jgi:hypothetical protein
MLVAHLLFTFLHPWATLSINYVWVLVSLDDLVAS